MGKHDTVRKNLMGVTRATSFRAALRGWSVERLIRLASGRRTAHCELCGTPFRNGALISHSRRNVTLTVGGICMGTILRGGFRESSRMLAERRRTAAYLRRLYGDLIEIGAWITWVFNNVPHGLANIAANLKFLGLVRTDRDLERLIRFHDSKRLYSRECLLDDIDLIEWLLSRRIPKLLTIDEAKALRKQADSQFAGEPIRSFSSRYMTAHLSPYVNGRSAQARAWIKLSVAQRRAIVALCALTDQQGSESRPICPGLVDKFNVAMRHPRFSRFVWNPTLGLGFVMDRMISEYALIWLWRDKKDPQRRFYLDYWRGVMPLSPSALRELEEQAFGQSSH